MVRQNNEKKESKINKEIKLSIGSGNRNLGEDWINIDGGDYPNVKNYMLWDLPYNDNSVSVIYSSHTLEYFDEFESEIILREWYRVLKPEGKIYIAVPDFEAMARLYLEDRIPLHKFIGPLYGKMKMGDKIIYHKRVFDYASLGELLRFVGFKRIEKHPPGIIIYDKLNADYTYDDQSFARIKGEYISLCLEAKK